MVLEVLFVPSLPWEADREFEGVAAKWGHMPADVEFGYAQHKGRVAGVLKLFIERIYPVIVCRSASMDSLLNILMVPRPSPIQPLSLIQALATSPA
jgi:hypothetical protein